MTEYENEPIAGLPGTPPPGEHILWQGAPEWRMLARTAFRTRIVAGYFGVLAAVALGTALRPGGSFVGLGGTVATGVVALALLNLLAWSAARTTIYTLTDRRVVLRFGIALPKCVNLPLALVASADLRLHADGSGDVPLTLVGPQPLGYIAYWPHARPGRIAAPQPMLRAVPDAAAVAALLARACLAAYPEGRVAAVVPVAPAQPVRAPAFAEAAAA